MWAKIKALPLRVKIIALVVFFGLGGIYKNFIDAPSSRGSYQPSYTATSSASSAGSAAPTISSSPGQASSEDSSQLLAKLQARLNLLQNQNAQCTAQIAQMNPWNYAPPSCEAQMQANTAVIAQLQAGIYRLQTGANVNAADFGFIGGSSSSPAGGGAATSDDGSNAVNRYSREGILGQSKYTDSNGNEYQLANQPYYYKDRASGNIVGSDYSQPPDNQHDWEQLTYQPN